MTVPPATNMDDLCAFIGKLVAARGVTHNLYVMSDNELDHPIPESKQQLLAEAIQLSQVLASVCNQYTNVELTEAKFAMNQVILMFTCSGDRTHEYIPIG
ncbi:hypothetical protein [Vibrio phage VP4B]|uniref:Uncharacterized protein n=1 Tax=Vibrio phage VP4B TaxID=1262540 RepID=V9LZQ7_9CAUD|nr:hypothetical protein FDJ61_gp071 [Vibrio phage VP4B]AGB07185.1 hypothetical protein [Vibrio phage VP4B]